MNKLFSEYSFMKRALRLQTKEKMIACVCVDENDPVKKKIL